MPTYVAPDIPCRLHGDEGRIRQILLNLISNAIKFTDTGAVTVSVSAPPLVGRDDSIILRFEISDTGIGIPPEMQQRIFEQFTQVDQSTTRQVGGTGLGLAICSRLVALMGDDRPGDERLLARLREFRTLEGIPVCSAVVHLLAQLSFREDEAEQLLTDLLEHRQQEKTLVFGKKPQWLEGSSQNGQLTFTEPSETFFPSVQ